MKGVPGKRVAPPGFRVHSSPEIIGTERRPLFPPYSAAGKRAAFPADFAFAFRG